MKTLITNNNIINNSELIALHKKIVNYFCYVLSRESFYCLKFIV